LGPYTSRHGPCAGLWLQVDASRRRNDPRKATRGCRAWCGLGVSPAPKGTDRRYRRGEGAKHPREVVPGESRHRRWVSPPQQASVGSKTRSAAHGPPRPKGASLDVTIRSRNVEVPDNLRATVEEKVSRLSRFLDGMDHAEILFSEERNPRI